MRQERDFWGDENILCLGCSGGHVTAYISQFKDQYNENG